jgi:hypothetical protein
MSDFDRRAAMLSHFLDAVTIKPHLNGVARHPCRMRAGCLKPPGP